MRRREPTPAELQILLALSVYQYLTTPQLLLAVGQRDADNMQRKLRRLIDDGFVFRIERHSTMRGKLHPGYMLTPLSVGLLRKTGYSVLDAHRPTRHILDHMLGISEVLVRAEALHNHRPTEIQLRRLLHDRELHRIHPTPLVIPDGFIEFVVAKDGKRFAYPLLIELDMGTVDYKRWKDKIERYTRFFHGKQFESIFETDVATVAVVSPLGQKRINQLRSWTETALKGSPLAELFYFRTLEPYMSAEDLFFGSGWSVVGQHELLPLLG